MTQKPCREVSQEISLNSQASRYIKPFSKYAPFLLIKFVKIQSSKQPFDVECKKTLLNGLYGLLDLCNKHGQDFILAALDSGGRPILKKLVSQWEKEHQFKG